MCYAGAVLTSHTSRDYVEWLLGYFFSTNVLFVEKRNSHVVTEIFLLPPHLAHISSAVMADSSLTISDAADVGVDRTDGVDHLLGQHSLE